MIQEFYVENFKSIKTKQGISFVPNKRMNNGFEDYLLSPVTDKIKLLKLGILYGYNASGKSNFLDAMQFLRDIILKSPDSKDQGIQFEPFLLDKETVDKPGSFYIVFYINKIKYEYFISLDKKRIYSETLYFTPEGRKSRVYSRTFDKENQISKIIFGSSCKFKAKDKLVLKGNTFENCSVIAAYRKTNVNSEEFENVSNYFKVNIMPVVFPQMSLENWSFSKFKENSGEKEFFIKLLAKADFQITDLKIEEEKINVTEKLITSLNNHGIPKQIIEDIKEKKQIEANKLLFSHSTKKGDYYIPMQQESVGTKRYFGLSGIMNELLQNPKVLALDEIETSLHPELVAFFLEMFLMNSKNSQMLVTTHNQQLMDQDYMRNDMIWFCEKDEEGASNYYSAQEFNLHKNVSVSNHYRAGKLGAFPNLGSPIIMKDGDANK